MASELELLREMLRIRRVEATVADVYPRGVIRTPTHLSIGQEAIAVGVCSVLRKTDQLFSGHRCHAHYLAKGGDLRRFMAELYGRETGCSRGRGGSVHLIDTGVGMMGSSAILGGSIALACGAAYALRDDGRDEIAVAFHGDAVMEEGIIWECFNLALLFKLPILFVCENNHYSTNTHYRRRQAGPPIHERVAGQGIRTATADGNDVLDVAAKTEALVAACRKGEPCFLEAETYRIREHVGPLYDHEQGIRSKEEVEAWQAKGPIVRFRALLRERGMLTDAEEKAMEEQVAAEVGDALKFAEESPWPDPAHILENVY